MQAAMLHEAHQPLTIEEVEHTPLKRREINDGCAPMKQSAPVRQLTEFSAG